MYSEHYLIDIDDSFIERITLAQKNSGITIAKLCRESEIQENTYYKITKYRSQKTIKSEQLNRIANVLKCGRGWLENGKGAIDDKDYVMFEQPEEKKELSDIFEYETSKIFAKFDLDWFGEDEQGCRYFVHYNINDSFINNKTLPKIAQADIMIMKHVKELERSGVYLIKYSNITMTKSIEIDIKHDYPIVYMNSDHGEHVTFDSNKFEIIGVAVALMKRL